VTGNEGRYRVIGTRPLRPDGADKVTGKAQFAADIQLPGMLHGRVKRSPHAHARIMRIDVSRAAALPGVHAIVTAADLPGLEDRVAELGEASVNMRELSGNILAHDKVLYRGHAVAAVAAINPHVAGEAVELIDVDYEPLPAVLDARDAMKPDAPLLDERRHTRSPVAAAEGPSNVAAHYQFVTGDPDAGFAEADVVVEREFATKMVHQGYIEPHAATAAWTNDGQLTIWTSTQGAFAVRDQCIAILDLAISKIKVIPTEIGGGFGGKTVVYVEPVAALLARKAARPVKVQMDRSEVFEGSGPTSGVNARVRMGATRDGRIVATDLELIYEAGAYPGSPVLAGCMTALAPYDIANSKIDGYDVVVNKPKVAAYRAPGAPAAAFAVEQAVDELAEELGIDPLRFRLSNSSREGTRGPANRPFPRIGHEECLEAALASAHYNAPLEGPCRGRGVASGFWFNGGMRSSVTVIVNADGSVSLVEGSTDIGGSRASLAMQLAETLGIGVDHVKPHVADTDAVGYNDVTGGSRVTFATGIAVHEAGMEVRRQMIERAAGHWQVPASEILYEDGKLTCSSDAGKSATFREMAVQLLRTGAPLVATGSIVGHGVGGAFSTQIADVEVDPDTGKVQVLRYTVVQDAGTAIHPAYVEGQMQGGVVQGIGWALNEEYWYDEQGRMANASFLDYRMPTALDVPMIETIIVEVPNPRHPFGVRGVGEVPIVPPLAAIANAVYRATGIRQTQLPMSPRRILETTAGLS
jgi:xanthine dehydrogenase molybdenum-binding subunit